MSGKKASVPGPGYTRKASPGGRIDGLTLKVTPETGKPFTVNASNWPGSLKMRQQALDALARLTSATGSWSTTDTVRSGSSPIRALLRWSAEQGIEDFADLTPASWNEMQLHLAALEVSGQKGVHTVHSYMRAFVREVAEVPEATRRLTYRRIGSPRQSEAKHSYRLEEFYRIREAAWATVEAAHERVWENYLHALQHEMNKLASEDDPAGQALLEILIHGRPSSREGFVAVGAVGASAADPRLRLRITEANRMLFISAAEAEAAAVLICCLEGLNKSVIHRRQVPQGAASLGDEQIALTVIDDKPRRGPKRRYSVTTLTQNPAVAVQIISEMTEPVRDHLERVGYPTSSLLAFWGRQKGSREGIPRTADRSWWPEGVPILDFQRLRRTVTNHVRKEPIAHTADTWIAAYRGLDEDLRGHALRAASRAAEEYEVAASVFFKGKLQAESDASQDTVLGGCADFSHHPDSGTDCQDSFLNCLGCANVVITPRHLPFQVAMFDALEEISTLRLADWETKFAIPYARLKALLTDGSLIPVEAVKDARQAVTGEHIDRVRSLLGGRYRP